MWLAFFGNMVLYYQNKPLECFDCSFADYRMQSGTHVTLDVRYSDHVMMFQVWKTWTLRQVKEQLAEFVQTIPIDDIVLSLCGQRTLQDDEIINIVGKSLGSMYALRMTLATGALVPAPSPRSPRVAQAGANRKKYPYPISWGVGCSPNPSPQPPQTW